MLTSFCSYEDDLLTVSELSDIDMYLDEIHPSLYSLFLTLCHPFDVSVIVTLSSLFTIYKTSKLEPGPLLTFKVSAVIIPTNSASFA